ncbi:hypothetical protein QBS63_08530 [Cronobacter sakazakii]|uniref:hypothetical protein n=1 Tax=Cronobacter sakazakii TaxID=28141 RepID=UPI0028117338|nr:hypothetical protein [Cronobacter sakazakii]MDQ9182074.1 hypothetical protein [Cronobacter sakazakii]MDQ9185395.1 hypothetical protein [Cronobacter sakazakii]MDQ9191433.1 hypothetical protein [Cronobacter sakazakii]MDQ9193586.1 hypothetical protein [Cronobacter sakazakii]
MTTLPILNVNAEITAPAEHTQLCFQICDFPQNHSVTASKVYALLQKRRFNGSQTKKRSLHGKFTELLSPYVHLLVKKAPFFIWAELSKRRLIFPFVKHVLLSVKAQNGPTCYPHIFSVCS